MLRPLLFVTVISACALAGDPSESVNQAALGAASVALSSSNAALTQTGDAAWSLQKTGSVDTSSKTVTWTITATKTATTSGQLVVTGFMGVTNSGGAGATIGNIVVNLQTRSGNTWKSVAADVADATSDDAATTAHIDPKASSENISTFQESSASGALAFMDASSNTVFSLVPEKTIAPGATVNLLFSASFDNHVLNLPTGRSVRAEVIVTFGNSTSHAPSAQNVDINGNGHVDSDEAWVRSVPARLGLTVPSQVGDNGTLTITDSASNIKTTGTVSFTNPSFNIGATSGTVTVSYDGGANGGKITNCAEGTGAGTTITVGGFVFPVVAGASLEACDTEEIGADTCTEGAAGCGWKTGDLTTYDQGGWDGNPGSTLTSGYSSVYGGGSLIVGGGFGLAFSDANAVLAYLPASGTARPLTASLQDPTDTASGVFGGDVVALQLDIDFSDAGRLAGSTGYKFGDLTLCSMTPSSLNNLSVRQYAAIANALLGGGSSGGFTGADITTLDPITADISAAFAGGEPSSFAQSHLVRGSCQ